MNGQGVTALLLSCCAAAAAANPFQALIEQRADAVVTVRYVYKVQMSFMGQSMDNEDAAEVYGVVVEPHGLVICSNMQLGGSIAMYSRMSGEMDTLVTPVGTKVILPGDTKEYTAQLIARDENRDIAWVQVDDAGGKEFPYVDFAASVEVALGDFVYAVGRMGKHFDRAPLVGEARIGGLCERPRRLYASADSLAGFVGLPVYTADNRVVGLVVAQMPHGADATPDEMELGSVLGMGATTILPAAEVLSALALAKDMVAGATE